MDKIKLTAVRRMKAAVRRHNILWTDLAMRVAENESISKEDAARHVCRLVEESGCALPVAVAIIDIIVDRSRNAN